MPRKAKSKVKTNRTSTDQQARLYGKVAAKDPARKPAKRKKKR